MIADYDAIIAGTEKISSKVLKSAKKLKLISRVGSGITNIDLKFAKSKGINICYTPDAPTNAVAEFTIGLILSLIRCIQKSNMRVSFFVWKPGGAREPAGPRRSQEAHF